MNPNKLPSNPPTPTNQAGPSTSKMSTISYIAAERHRQQRLTGSSSNPNPVAFAAGGIAGVFPPIASQPNIAQRFNLSQQRQQLLKAGYNQELKNHIFDTFINEMRGFNFIYRKDAPNTVSSGFLDFFQQNSDYFKSIIENDEGGNNLKQFLIEHPENKAAYQQMINLFIFFLVNDEQADQIAPMLAMANTGDNQAQIEAFKKVRQFFIQNQGLHLYDKFKIDQVDYLAQYVNEWRKLGADIA
jgi:hypothetical protein